MAWDADEEPIDVAWTLDGDEVRMRVEHRSGDVAYPVVVDPIVTGTFYFAYQGDEAFAFWNKADASRTGTKFQNDFVKGNSFLGRGLHMNHDTPTQFDAGEYGMWYFAAPGRAQIYRNYTYRFARQAGFLKTCQFWGLMNGSFTAWEAPYGQGFNEGCGGNYSQFASTVTASSGGTPGNFFLTGEYAYATGSHTFRNMLGDSELYISDYDDPDQLAINPGGGWVGPNKPIAITAHDPSLGIRRISPSGPSGWDQIRDYDFSCPYGPCEQTRTINVPVGNLAEGTRSVQVAARDAVDRITLASANVRVDKTAPTLEVTGDLRQLVRDDSAGDSYAVHSEVRDNAGTAQSGARTLQVKLDGLTKHSVARDAACGDACTITDEYFLSTAGLSAGPHVVRVEAADAAGNVSSEQWTFEVAQPDAYSYEVEGPEIGGDDGQVEGEFEADDGCEPVPDVDDCSDIGGSDPQIASEPPLGSMGAGVGAQSLSPGDSGWGMAFQAAEDHDRPEMNELAPSRVRIVVPWDTALRPFKATACGAKGDKNGNYANLKKWVKRASQLNREPLVSFGRCADGSEYKNLPTVTQYKEAILRFLNNPNFDDIDLFTAWNEPNSDGQPTSYAQAAKRIKECKDARRTDCDALPTGNESAQRAGQFWTAFHLYCVAPDPDFDCTVAAGEFVDGKEFEGSYYTWYDKGVTRQPSVWAFHPYVAGQTGNTSRFDRFRDITSRPNAPDSLIWFTEQGGIVNSKTFPNQTEQVARAATGRLINDLVNRSSRITRFYYYALRGDPLPKFDSGLLRLNGSKRDVFADYKAKINP